MSATTDKIRGVKSLSLQEENKMTKWEIYEIGEKKIFVEKNRKGTTYCPDCCQGDLKKRTVKKKFFFGLLTKRIEKNYWSKKRNVQRYETKTGSYCGKCRMLLGIKI